MVHAKENCTLNSSAVSEETMSCLAGIALYVVSESCSYIIDCLPIYTVDTMGIDSNL